MGMGLVKSRGIWDGDDAKRDWKERDEVETERRM